MRRHHLGLRPSHLFRIVLAATICLAALPMAVGQDVLRVEEDWELHVDHPDQTTSGPQVTCAFSPTGDLDCTHATFDLNHRGMASSPAGGFGLSVWDGESHYGSCMSSSVTRLATPNEKVTWTQRMEVTLGGIAFEIVNGQSSTWGAFGNDGCPRVVVNSQVTNLNQYDPMVSVNNSGVGYAKHRVHGLTLKAIRIYTADGQVYELSADGPTTNP